MHCTGGLPTDLSPKACGPTTSQVRASPPLLCCVQRTQDPPPQPSPNTMIRLATGNQVCTYLALPAAPASHGVFTPTKAAPAVAPVPWLELAAPAAP